MRPTITEQLRGIRRILDEVVLPEIKTAYPADTLRGVLAHLDVLEHAWDRVLPFLHWDTAVVTALLTEIEGLVDLPLAERLRATCATAPADGLSFDVVNAHNEALRALLADAVPQLAAGGERTAPVYAKVRAHLREYMSRYPMTFTTTGAPAAR